VRCTLSFSGSRFTVAVPWSALFAITSHVTKEFWMYPDDMPPELIQQTMVTSKVPESVTEQPAPAERPKVVLREVVLHEEPPPPAEEPAVPAVPAPMAATETPPKDEPPTPRRGHLRLVK
jgi:stringent starvation protein B